MSYFIAFFLSLLIPTSLMALKIAVLVPFEHQAMHEIEEGIRSVGTNHSVTTFRAYGDMNVLSQHIKNIAHKNFDIVVPIGTLSSQMTLSILDAQNHQAKVICAAASLGLGDIKANQDQVYFISDEIDLKDIVRDLSPWIKSYAVIYSASDKSFKDMKGLVPAFAQYAVAYEEKVIHQTQDLPAALRSIKKDKQALLIFKDHLIVSALPYLIEEAKRREIPLIVSDLSSVQKGATLGYGIAEKDIGVAVAKMIQKIEQNQDLNRKEKLGDDAYWAVNLAALESQKQITRSDLYDLEVVVDY